MKTKGPKPKPGFAHAADREFLAWCGVWEKAGRAPLGFTDWLIEKGLPAEAEAVRWAAAEPDRPGSLPAPDLPQHPFNWDGIYPFGPSPRTENLAKSYYWSFVWTDQTRAVRCDLPNDVFTRLTNDGYASAYYPSFAAAVAALLEAWAKARPVTR